MPIYFTQMQVLCENTTTCCHRPHSLKLVKQRCSSVVPRVQSADEHDCSVKRKWPLQKVATKSRFDTNTHLTGWKAFLLRSDWDCSTLIFCDVDSIWKQKQISLTFCMMNITEHSYIYFSICQPFYNLLGKFSKIYSRSLRHWPPF